MFLIHSLQFFSINVPINTLKNVLIIYHIQSIVLKNDNRAMNKIALFMELT